MGESSAAPEEAASQSKVELMCLGLATLDTIVWLPDWPAPDGRMVVDELLRAGGGPSATAAVAAARLGRAVGFSGAVGDDPTGAAVRQELVAAGVEVEHLARLPGPTAESVILVDGRTAGRSILHRPGVALERLTPAAAAACSAARWVHVDHAGWSLAADLPRERLSVDAGNPIVGLTLDGIGLYAPTAAALAGRYPGRDPLAGMACALADGALRVAVTLGSDGAVAAERGRAWRVDGVAVQAISTLGAGDVFHGALLAALLDEQPLGEALRRANLAAALSCRGLDGRSAVPITAELEQALDGAPPARPIDLEGMT